MGHDWSYTEKSFLEAQKDGRRVIPGRHIGYALLHRMGTVQPITSNQGTEPLGQN